MRYFILLVLLLLVLGLPVARFRSQNRLPRNRVLHMALRLHMRMRPGRGHASALQLWHRWGRLASYRESKRTRPSLTRWQRIRRPQEHSFYLGRAHLRHTLRVSVQEHGAIIGPPRSYKSALLSRVIMAAPGAVVSTSSKGDIFRLTGGVRSRRGPIFTFNPQGIGGIPSNVRWSPLTGCSDPATAIRRGTAFGSATSTAGAEDANFWRREGAIGLQALFSAAALAGRSMRQVGRWAGVSRETPEAVLVLDQAERGDWAAKLAELNGPAEKTAQTIRTVMSSALGFLRDPALAASVLPGPGQEFDIDQFLLKRGTLYMIARGDEEDSTLGPLFAALASEIQYRATQLGALMPGGRLDPPLLMALDEVTQICPVPLPQWLADSGGQGVSIWTAFHGFAQLRGRWKADGAQAVMDTTNVRVFMPGLADTETLDRASKLCGQAAYLEHGQEHHSRHDVVTPDMIRQLPHGFGLLLRGSGRPVVAKLARGWKDREYRKLRRRGQDEAIVTAAGLPLALREPVLAAGVGAQPVARLRAASDSDMAADWDAAAAELAEVLPVEPPPAHPWGGDR